MGLSDIEIRHAKISGAIQTLKEDVLICEKCHNNKVFCEFHTKEMYRILKIYVK